MEQKNYEVMEFLRRKNDKGERVAKTLLRKSKIIDVGEVEAWSVVYDAEYEKYYFVDFYDGFAEKSYHTILRDSAFYLILENRRYVTQAGRDHFAS